MFCSQRIIPIRKLSFTQVIYNRKKARLDFGLDRLERRHLKRRLLEAQSSLFKKHIYKTSFNVNNKFELAELLTSTQLYNEDGLIALTKPFGVPRSKTEELKEKTMVSETLNSAGNVSQTSIEEIIPLLKRHYNVEKLDVLFYPERYTSGIMLLSHNDKLSNKVKKCFRRSLGLQQPNQTYWIVSLGKPVPEATAEKVAIDFHYVHNIGKIPVIKKQFSNTKRKTGDIKMNNVIHSVMAHNEEIDIALVEASVLNIKHHFLRVWMAHCYAPVLGDLICGGRVKTVFGKKILVSPNNMAGYQPPDISSKLLTKLYLSRSQVEVIPVHIHQSELKLARFLSASKDLVINAPPPDHFVWTCMQLSLFDENDDDAIDPEEDIFEELEEVTNMETL